MLPSVSHENGSFRNNVSYENRSPKRRLDKKRNERVIGSYAGDKRQFARQPSISEEHENTKVEPCEQNNINNRRLTIVPEWLRKNPLQLHYINNCDRTKHHINHRGKHEVHEAECNAQSENKKGKQI